MKPESERYLAKARLTLEHARVMLTVNLTEDAGRAADLAGYQAAAVDDAERFIDCISGLIATCRTGSDG